MTKQMTIDYNYNWQCVNEYLGTAWNARFIWGLRYVDDLLLRDMDNAGNGSATNRDYALQDANWNIVTLVDQNCDILERMVYNAFGSIIFTYYNYTQTPASTRFNWNRTFTGQTYDAETGRDMQVDRVHLHQ
jgi:hypothetical protein